MRNNSNPASVASRADFLSAFSVAPAPKQDKAKASEGEAKARPFKVTSQEVNAMVGAYVTNGRTASQSMVDDARRVLPLVTLPNGEVNPNAFATRATRSSLTFRTPDGVKVTGVAFRLYFACLREIVAKASK